MNKSLKKIVCGALASIMVVGTAITAYAAHPFTDVNSGSWYESYVDYAYTHHLMDGTAPDKFSPSTMMTRGMLVTVLHRLAGNPAPNSSSPFTDIGTDLWYTDAIKWCYGAGITDGTSPSTFSPNAKVTREQFVVFMMRYAEYSGLNVAKRAPLNRYVDIDDLASYAEEAMSWAVANGLIEGTAPNTLSPKGSATRAQCAVILQCYDELLKDLNPEPTEPSQPEPTEPSKPDVTDPTVPSQPEPTEPSKPEPTEPSQPDPTEPTVHTHEWKHTHYDAVGHNEEKFVCVDCGWYCTESMAEAEGMDLVSYWVLRHQNPMAQKGEQHSYDAKNEWHVDSPAYDEWSCACGQTVFADPNA